MIAAWRHVVVFLLALATSSVSFAQDMVFTGKPKQFDDFGYFVTGSAWAFKPGAAPVIFVCWEDMTSSNADARKWVEDQIQKTWGRASPIKFRGWQKCLAKNDGIRIAFKDEGARVKAFGKAINGVKDGMILNAAFKNWSQACQTMRESCIRSIAVHEFGHALGFAHEQNRPDTPGECAAAQGQNQPNEQMLTPYDPESVMNYCNSKYNNDGKLSERDVISVQKVYGKPK